MNKIVEFHHELITRDVIDAFGIPNERLGMKFAVNN